jgi:F-type H+-transporting ATPase subunit b
MSVFASGGEHAEAGVPKVVLYQAINVVLVVILLTYLTRQKLRNHFEVRRENYIETLKKVERAKAEAEKKNREVKSRIEVLENTSAGSIARAQTEAKELQDKIISEAESLAKKIREEASRAAESEVRKAIESLREEVFKQSVEAAKSAMKQQIKAQDQERLQKEFVEKIQVVQQ